LQTREQHKIITGWATRIYFVFVLLFLIILCRVWNIQHSERDRWIALGDSIRKENVESPHLAKRGNILSDDGQLMVATVKEYDAAIDFRTEGLRANNGERFKKNVDSLALCLHALRGERSIEQYRDLLWRGYNSKTRYCKLFQKPISHSEYKQMKTFPLIREGKYKSGFTADIETNCKIKRSMPFGSLAAVTLGSYSSETNRPTRGIEYAFDKYLKGTDGIDRRKRAAGAWIKKPVVEAIDGCDITTTLNVVMQDICEQALRHRAEQIDAECGVVILMEVATGEIKALVNLNRSDSSYKENESIALTSHMEPGSTFKVPALMAALEDGTVKLTDTVDCGDGIWDLNSSIRISDANTGEKANHKIPVGQAIVRSSNVAMGKIIYENYGTKERANHYVEILKKMGVGKPIDLGFKGCANARIEGPKERGKEWIYTDIASMAYGYSVDMPLLYTLTFYNAIANGGKMMQPYIVKRASRDGITVKEWGPKVMVESICKPSTLNAIKPLMLGVVEDEHGTGKAAYSEYTRIAGKTGTARYNYRAGQGGYKHQVSFCGFFPYENPKYSCIIYFRNPGVGGAGGGWMCGPVMKQIAERVMASVEYIPVEKFVADSARSMEPTPAKMMSADAAMLKRCFGADSTQIRVITPQISGNEFPNLVGMGLKDAIFIAERRGKTVVTHGKNGKVKRMEMVGNKCHLYR